MGHILETCTSRKEDQFAVLDPIRNCRKMAEFEDRLGKPKPLLGGTFSRFAGPEWLQHGAVEHYHTISKNEILCNPYVYWISALLDVLF